jgi:hypothetical protein
MRCLVLRLIALRGGVQLFIQTFNPMYSCYFTMKIHHLKWPDFRNCFACGNRCKGDAFLNSGCPKAVNIHMKHVNAMGYSKILVSDAASRWFSKYSLLAESIWYALSTFASWCFDVFPKIRFKIAMISPPVVIENHFHYLLHLYYNAIQSICKIEINDGIHRFFRYNKSM